MWELAVKEEDKTSLNQHAYKTIPIKQIKIIRTKRRNRRSVNIIRDF